MPVEIRSRVKNSKKSEEFSDIKPENDVIKKPKNKKKKKKKGNKMDNDNLSFVDNIDDSQKVESVTFSGMEDVLYGEEKPESKEIKADKKRIRERVKKEKKEKLKNNKVDNKEEKEMKENIIVRAAKTVWNGIKTAFEWVGRGIKKVFGIFGRKAAETA